MELAPDHSERGRLLGGPPATSRGLGQLSGGRAKGRKRFCTRPRPPAVMMIEQGSSLCGDIGAAFKSRAHGCGKRGCDERKGMEGDLQLRSTRARSGRERQGLHQRTTIAIGVQPVIGKFCIEPNCAINQRGKIIDIGDAPCSREPHELLIDSPDPPRAIALCPDYNHAGDEAICQRAWPPWIAIGQPPYPPTRWLANAIIASSARPIRECRRS
jgi:hypothetical protein